MLTGVQFFEVTENEAQQRLDNFLVTRLKGVPKALVYRVIRKGEVRVNKGRAQPDRRLQIGDVVRVPPMRLSEATAVPVPSQSQVTALQQAIVYDHEGLLVVNKPSGLAVHGGSGVRLGLIESLRQLPGHKGFLELVHRLDKETSGLVMVAKKRSMLTFLQQALRERGRVQKTYWALVRGHWPKQLHQVDAPLLRSDGKGGERYVKVHTEGKPSLTHFKVLQRFQDATLVEAKPITGRTHQIRVHAKHAGHALVGDEKYGDAGFNAQMQRLGIDRLFLHAAALALVLPNEQTLQLEAPLPLNLQQALTRLVQAEGV